ncbi:hypothetical protein FHW12_002959 [Dokdonella fugitiva]|uniref:Uncharacterized protein n=1 Tax=Dokdonella fugitiva TaxID=328517 RepID=A0A839F195_9GAMM|nr:hypothetical protein [Dokdonella fugitiva]MBA8888723.1 hypothetical protein [Dokdonella fugitiva]
MRAAVVLLSLCLPSVAFAAAPFIAAPVPVGSLVVPLCPTEAVTPGAAHLVTFGLPFPRGSVTGAQLANVRVLSGASEVPAFVEQLTPWRHRTNAALDGTSVRVARIQIEHAFTGSACENVSVSWGGVPRTQNRPALVPPRTAWHTVASGSFVAADGVQEPDVYAVLPKDWLARGVLKGVQDVPFDASVAPARDDPATMDATEHWPGYVEADHAQKNNFFSVINEDDAGVAAANQCPYKTDYEPWLYDRSATMYALYFRSGLLKALREAVRASDFYADHIDANGWFTLKGEDTKYVYPENLAYTAWLTGDTTQLAHVPAMLAAHDTFPDVWVTNPDRFWTERHAAFKLLANAIAWELDGGSAQRAKVDAEIAELVRHQDGADGQIPHPPAYVDGGLYHLGTQHDYDWNETSYGASSWMSVLLVDAALRAYATAEDTPTAQLIRRLGTFLRASVVITPEHSYDTYEDALPLPRYAMLSDGSDGQRNYEDIEHALDVAAGLAWAGYFADLTGLPDPTLRDTAAELYYSYDIGVNYWIRPAGPASGLTAYRVAPWRKWGWEQRVAVGFVWAMRAEGDVIFANGYDA